MEKGSLASQYADANFIFFSPSAAAIHADVRLHVLGRSGAAGTMYMKGVRAAAIDAHTHTRKNAFRSLATPAMSLRLFLPTASTTQTNVRRVALPANPITFFPRKSGSFKREGAPKYFSIFILPSEPFVMLMLSLCFKLHQSALALRSRRRFLIFRFCAHTLPGWNFDGAVKFRRLTPTTCHCCRHENAILAGVNGSYMPCLNKHYYFQRGP